MSQIPIFLFWWLYVFIYLLDWIKLNALLLYEEYWIHVVMEIRSIRFALRPSCGYHSRKVRCLNTNSESTTKGRKKLEFNFPTRKLVYILFISIIIQLKQNQIMYRQILKFQVVHGRIKRFLLFRTILKRCI